MTVEPMIDTLYLVTCPHGPHPWSGGRGSGESLTGVTTEARERLESRTPSSKVNWEEFGLKPVLELGRTLKVKSMGGFQDPLEPQILWLAAL